MQTNGSDFNGLLAAMSSLTLARLGGLQWLSEKIRDGNDEDANKKQRRKMLIASEVTPTRSLSRKKVSSIINKSINFFCIYF